MFGNPVAGFLRRQPAQPGRLAIGYLGHGGADTVDLFLVEAKKLLLGFVTTFGQQARLLNRLQV